MTKWYALNQWGVMIFVGEFASFDDADKALESGAVWLADEATARGWLTQLEGMLK